MTPENFCNWLQGYLELANPGEIRAEEIKIIRDHLDLVKNSSSDWGDPPYYAGSLRFGISKDKVRPANC